MANVCVIYDQLLKLAISESLIGEVKFTIARKFSEACASDSFMQIDESTLVAILNFRWLNIPELNLLKVCLKWADNEATRHDSAADTTSKRRVFEPIKHLIRFGDLSLSEFSSVSNIRSFLTVEEIGSIFLHFTHKDPIQIDYRSPRVSSGTHVAKAFKETEISERRSLELKYFLSVDQRVCLFSIATFASFGRESLSFQISRDEGNESLDPKVLTGQYTSDRWLIDLRELNFLLEPNAVYKLQFSFSVRHGYSYSFGTSKGMALKSDETGTVFKIESDSGQHCIETISFFPFE